MEQQLKSLFDFQHFARNTKLQAVIDRIASRYDMTELEDEDLEFLAAAGEAKAEIKGSGWEMKK